MDIYTILSESNTAQAPQPGTVVRVDRLPYCHWAVVSNRIGHDGKFMLIDIDKGRSIISERNYSDVIGDRRYYIEGVDWPDERKIQILNDARNNIGKRWTYHFRCNNCEHFVRLITTGKKESRQVNIATEAALAGGLVALLNGSSVAGIAGRSLFWGAVGLAVDNSRRQL